MNPKNFWVMLGLLALGMAGMAPDDPPAGGGPDSKFETLLAEARKDPEKADWTVLRRAFAETSHYNPYDIAVDQQLKKISQAIGRGEVEESEAALLKLLERDRFMRFDTLAMMMMLHERTGQEEKAKPYRKLLEGLLNLLQDPKAGVSFEKPIEVLFIQEEYLVTTNLTAKRRGLISHEGHKFDVFDVEAEGDQPARAIYFNVDLPQKSLTRLLEKKPSK